MLRVRMNEISECDEAYIVQSALVRNKRDIMRIYEFMSGIKCLLYEIDNILIHIFMINICNISLSCNLNLL